MTKGILMEKSVPVLRKQIEVINPATGECIATVPSFSAEDVQQATGKAAEAFPAWRERLAGERATVLRRWAALIKERQEELSRQLTAEQGKPLSEARGEISYAASFIEWFAEEARRVYGEIIPSHKEHTRLEVTKEPVGVCVAITPWNFPAAMMTRKAGAALAAGCTMIVKPASETPLTAIALGELAYEAGVPEGVLQVVTGEASVIGKVLTESGTVRKISFTGSTEVGRILMANSAPTLKRLSLELGGNAPFIVCDDADVDAAVEGAMLSKYRNSGQTCVCANRFLVQDGVYDEFITKLAQAAAGMKVGNGMEEGVQQGPLINMKALEKVESLVRSALSGGARCVTGGRRHTLGGTFYEPTVLADVSPETEMFREEIFGPVAAVYRFETDEEAIRLANDTEYGLAAYLYTKDASRIYRISEALEYGMVGVNTGHMSTAVAPFGGVKQSGYGREGSRHGIEEYLNLKYLCLHMQ